MRGVQDRQRAESVKYRKERRYLAVEVEALKMDLSRFKNLIFDRPTGSRINTHHTINSVNLFVRSLKRLGIPSESLLCSVL